ncbi:MAG: hypothetical protein PHW76_05805 [Alphaproteobacteria bacterium]|nr:hypothetical protein [Alphaproteobacteria bacterium]
MAATLDKQPETLTREERAALALRENLRKRKEQEQKRAAKTETKKEA